MGVCDHLDIEQDTHLGKSWTMKIGYLDIDSLPHRPSKSLDYCQTLMIEFHYLLKKETVMSTRSCVAIPQGDGWKGRYVHSDGYPEHMLPTLLDLIARKGVDRVVDVLLNWNPGWSFIGSYEGITNYLGDDRAHFVSDYGLAYTKHEANMNDWLTDTDNDALFIEYIYIIGPKSLTVLESYNTGETETRERWDGSPYEAAKYSHRLLDTIRYSDALIGV